MKFLITLLLGGALLAQSVRAEIDTYTFTSAQQEQAYRELTQQLRCPKCQNNSIADSNSEIAAGMRQKVYELLQQGEDKQQITQYMVARYGNFVTYDPPFTLATAILWIGPCLVLLIGGGVVWSLSRRRGTPGCDVLTPEEQQRWKTLFTADKERKS